MKLIPKSGILFYIIISKNEKNIRKLKKKYSNNLEYIKVFSIFASEIKIKETSIKKKVLVIYFRVITF